MDRRINHISDLKAYSDFAELQNLQIVGSFKQRRNPMLSSLQCFKCKEMGHFAKDCRLTFDRCYKCGIVGHIAKTCVNDDIEAGSCYVCGEMGHLQSECPHTEQRVCYNCQGMGHFSKECQETKALFSQRKSRKLRMKPSTGIVQKPDENTPVGFQSKETEVHERHINTILCYNCHKHGHIARNCEKLLCYICSEAGHIAKNCPAGTLQRMQRMHIVKNCPSGTQAPTTLSS